LQDAYNSTIQRAIDVKDDLEFVTTRLKQVGNKRPISKEEEEMLPLQHFDDLQSVLQSQDSLLTRLKLEQSRFQLLNLLDFPKSNLKEKSSIEQGKLMPVVCH
jgi:hypothetical protein